MALDRRRFVKWAAASAAAAVSGCAGTIGGFSSRVVVIGGGYGGATAARYLKEWAPELDVTLVERNEEFVSCPLSNLVLGGVTGIGSIAFGYENLRARGVRVVHGEAKAIDVEGRRVRLADGTTLAYDRVIVSPSVDYLYDKLPGLATPEARARVPHAWKAGPETLALRKQLEAMRDGGVFAIHVPTVPFRCPPGPYERVCQVADYFKHFKPRSKIIVLDSNPDLVSKRNLFLAAWSDLYKGMIDYRPNSELEDVDVKNMTLKLVFDDVKADVLNVIPPQRAGDIARTTGLIAGNQHWCPVDWLTCESVVQGVHVLGDATLAASGMPKSATMANQHAKVCAAAVIALLKGEPVNPRPMMVNTCYSFVDAKSAVHVASVHAYDAEHRTMVPVRGAGGLSDKASALEGTYAWGWARNIWGEALG
jgi:NADPH-dependent 2,4-dienoyl-CoA reductase/sulfur reductase-like enzyme